MTSDARIFLSTAFRVTALAVVYLLCFAGAYSLFLPPSPSLATNANEPLPASLALLLVSGLNTVVIAWIILRSRWHGWRLVLSGIAVLYGVQTVLPQTETLLFPAVSGRMPAGTVQGLFVAGLVHAAIFIPFAILVLGRWRARMTAMPPRTVTMPSREWAWRVGVAVAAYVVLYFTFGYYIAWTNEAVTSYYGGTDPGTFLGQLRVVFTDTPWLPLAQVARGVLWVVVSLPLIAMMNSSRVETMLATASFLAVVMNAALLVPNPYMPFDVRMIHLVETSASNFLFGALLGWLFTSDRTLPAFVRREVT